MSAPHTVAFPDTGVWRLGRGPDPLVWRRPEPVDTRDHRGGNRFDSFHGNFGVLYGASNPIGCYSETLARFRPKPALAELVRAEWSQQGWMGVGSVAADWRNSRVLARVAIEASLPFVDVAHPQTLEAFRSEPRITAWLESFGIEELDLSTVVGGDRRVTRLISQWAAESMENDDTPSYGGIRYLSRLGEGLECWAIFEGCQIVELERRSVLATDTDLCAVATRFHLTVH